MTWIAPFTDYICIMGGFYSEQKHGLNGSNANFSFCCYSEVGLISEAETSSEGQAGVFNGEDLGRIASVCRCCNVSTCIHG